MRRPTAAASASSHKHSKNRKPRDCYACCSDHGSSIRSLTVLIPAYPLPLRCLLESFSIFFYLRPLDWPFDWRLAVCVRFGSSVCFSLFGLHFPFAAAPKWPTSTRRFNSSSSSRDNRPDRRPRSVRQQSSTAEQQRRPAELCFSTAFFFQLSPVDPPAPLHPRGSEGDVGAKGGRCEQKECALRSVCGLCVSPALSASLWPSG